MAEAALQDPRAPKLTPLRGAGTGSVTPLLISPGELIITPDSAGIEALSNYSLTTPPDAGTKHLKGKHGKVYIVRPSTRRGQVRKRSPLAIKRQMIKNPKNLNDMAFREIRISQQLQRLHLPNFLEIKGHAKVFASHLGRIPFASPTGADKENPQYLHCIMEYGGSETIHARKTVTVAELRAFSFQLIFALHKAQKKYQFVHGDLHLKNMMLKPNSTKLAYEDGGLVWELDGPVVKIIDFGLSRLRLDNGEVLFNDKAKLRDLYSASADYEQLAMGLGTLKVGDWDAAPPVEREDWRDLRRRLLKGAFQSSEELIRHRFFEPLRLRPRAKALPPVPTFNAPSAQAAKTAAAATQTIAAAPPVVLQKDSAPAIIITKPEAVPKTVQPLQERPPVPAAALKLRLSDSATITYVPTAPAAEAATKATAGTRPPAQIVRVAPSVGTLKRKAPEPAQTVVAVKAAPAKKATASRARPTPTPAPPLRAPIKAKATPKRKMSESAPAEAAPRTTRHAKPQHAPASATLTTGRKRVAPAAPAAAAAPPPEYVGKRVRTARKLFNHT